jgi:Cu/Ag efflux pump CusA
MSENIEKHRMEFLLENYKTLREEILEAIRLQNKIIMGEAIAVGIILGFGLAGTTYKVVLIAIPFVIIILNSYWAVEQSRMMRAGNFMQFLEDKINLKLGGAYVVWENWLRRETDKKNNRSFVQKIRYMIKDWRKPKDANIIHHRAQCLSILGVFYLVGVIIIFAFLYSPNRFDISIFKDMARYIYIGLLFAYLVIFLLSIIPVFQVIRHRGTPAEKTEFSEWSKKYWEDMNKAYSTWWGRP